MVDATDKNSTDGYGIKGYYLPKVKTKLDDKVICSSISKDKYHRDFISTVI